MAPFLGQEEENSFPPSEKGCLFTTKPLLNESVSEEQADKTQETHAANGEELLYSLLHSPFSPHLSFSLSLSLFTFVGAFWWNMKRQCVSIDVI